MNYDEKIELYLKEAKKIFSGVKFSSAVSMFNTHNSSSAQSGKIELDSRFLNEIALKDGPVEFIHYTSLITAMNILNSENIRLYNCDNLNDPSEINYLLDQSTLEINKEEIKKYKREHFILSGCKYISENDEDYNMWRLYGDTGKGVAIVFEIDNKIKNWKNIFLQHVDYGQASNKTSNFLKFHAEFDEKHKLFQNNPEILSLLATGVKNEIWSIEKEFRIVIKCPFNQRSLKATNRLSSTNSLIYETLKHELKPNGKMVSFVELPLSLNKYQSQKAKRPTSGVEVDLLDYVPNLKIKKIILGPNRSSKELSDFIKYKRWISEKVGYEFEVSESSIKF